MGGNIFVVTEREHLEEGDLEYFPYCGLYKHNILVSLGCQCFN